MRDPFDGIMPKALRSMMDLEQRIIGPQQKFLGATPLIADIERQQKMLAPPGIPSARDSLGLNVAGIAFAKDVLGNSRGILNATEFHNRAMGALSHLGGGLAEITSRQERFNVLADRMVGPMFDALSSKTLRMNHFPDGGILRAVELARPLFASQMLIDRSSFTITALRDDDEIVGLASSLAADAALDVFALRYEPTDDVDAIRVEVPCSCCDGEIGLERVVYGNLPARRPGLVLCDTCLGLAESEPEKFVVMLTHAKRARVLRDVIDGEGRGDGVRIGLLRIVECTSEDEDDND